MGTETNLFGVLRFRLPLAALACALVLTGCGQSDATGDPIEALAGNAGKPVEGLILQTDNSLVPQISNPVFSDANGTDDDTIADPNVSSDLPFSDPTSLDNLGEVVTMADTGIRITSDPDHPLSRVELEFIQTSWTYMQSCLNVVATAPLVIVSNTPPKPNSSQDDVLYHIDGTITATATLYSSGATVQLNVIDLDGTLSRVGFNLRSIFGRYLWTSANLSESNYPHHCASVQ
jgi:hypothetical protein